MKDKTPEHRARLAAAMSAYWKNPERSAKHKEAWLAAVSKSWTDEKRRERYAAKDSRIVERPKQARGAHR